MESQRAVKLFRMTNPQTYILSKKELYDLRNYCMQFNKNIIIQRVDVVEPL